MVNYEVRRVKEEDYQDIHKLNKQLGYEYDVEKVKERILNLLETGSDIISVLTVHQQVVGYVHGIPYHTLYADNLFNMVAIVFSNDYDVTDDMKKKLLSEFENRVIKNGYYGVRLSADAERDTLHEFLIQSGFESKRDQKHYIKFLERLN